MASKPKGVKRKLPRDLNEASKQARAHLTTSKSVLDAYEVLRTTELYSPAMGTSENYIIVHLIARHGIAKIAQICAVLSGFPKSLNSFLVSKYISLLTGIDDAAPIASLVLTNCPDLMTAFAPSNPPSPTLLAPPVSTCLECHRQLTFNHDCEVIGLLIFIIRMLRLMH